MLYPGDDVLPAIGPEHAGIERTALIGAEVATRDGGEVLDVSSSLSLQQAVDTRDQFDQVSDRLVTLRRCELRVFSLPLELVRWLVIVVVIYTAVTMLAAGLRAEGTRDER